MTNQNTAKTAQKQPGLMPTLRFPEFKDAGQWDVLELNNVADFISEKVPVKSISLADYVSTENILSDYAGIEIASKLPATGSVTEYARNDILISNIRPYLKKVWFANKAGGSSNDVIVVRAKENILAIYLSFILKNDAFIDYVMKGAKGVKMPRGDIELIKKYNIFYPQSQEQQKIAECLASLDEVISAHSEKLEALKVHKKGLMQNLFPAQGQTTPQYRFPEFKNAGEWEEKPIKEIFTIFQGFAFSSNDSVPNGVRWLKIADVSIQKMNHESPSFLPPEHQQKYDKFSVYEGEYVLALTRPILNGQLKIAPVDELFDGALLNQRVGKLVTEQNSSFVYYLLQTSKLITDIEKSISGSEPPNLSAQQIESLKTRVPDSPKEQQKIAACLSSLDDLITAQTQKIDALKQYKKGLMQQLFPVVES